MEDNNQSNNSDFFKAEKEDGDSLESTSSNLFTVSEDVNPLVYC